MNKVNILSTIIFTIFMSHSLSAETILKCYKKSNKRKYYEFADELSIQKEGVRFSSHVFRGIDSKKGRLLFETNKKTVFERIITARAFGSLVTVKSSDPTQFSKTFSGVEYSCKHNIPVIDEPKGVELVCEEFFNPHRTIGTCEYLTTENIDHGRRVTEISPNFNLEEYNNEIREMYPQQYSQ